ncbi:MAG: hypothetical protein HOP11_07895 [Saprospiraceae bacterium]|nr:hypothetical protein [Saprospiraceae bacterium]
MKVLYFLGMTFLLLALWTSCSKNSNFEYDSTSSSEIDSRSVLDSLIDTCKCQIKFHKLWRCNDCPDTSLNWVVRNFSNGVNLNSYSNQFNPLGTWFGITLIKNANGKLVFFPTYSLGNKGETHLDVMLRCEKVVGTGYNTRNIRITAWPGIDSCMVADSIGMGMRNIKIDSLCRFIVPPSNYNPFVSPCAIPHDCLGCEM